MAREAAELAKERGSAAYRRGEFTKAAEAYEEAERIDPSEPVYASNLSAVCYEQGEYVKSVEAIIRSWRVLRAKNAVDGTPSTPPSTDPLAHKLAVRFVKSRLQGVRSGAFSLHDKKPKKKQTSESSKNIEKDIGLFITQKLEEVEGEKVGELGTSWTKWSEVVERCSGHTREECERDAGGSRKRAGELPLFRKSLEPIVEYFRLGHDEIRSLLVGNGSGKQRPLAIDRSSIKQDNLHNLAFLIGGSGDARHVFGTLYHLADIRSKFRRGETMPKMHLSLIDIHPATHARVVLIFGLMRKALLADRADSKREIETTIFYTYTSLLLPDYCHQILIDTARELFVELGQGGPKLLSRGLHIAPESLPQILRVLEYWTSPLGFSTKKVVEANSEPTRTNALLDDLPRYRQAATMMRLPAPQNVPGYNDPVAEQNIHDRLRVLLPPREYLGRHPNLEKYVKKSEGTEASRLKAAKEEIDATWKPVPTLFEPHDGGHQPLEHLSPNGYPILELDTPFYTVKDCIHAALFVLDGPGNFQVCADLSAHAIVTGFFRLVIDALGRIGDDLTVEFALGDVMAGATRLVNGEMGGRPANFPKKFLRMWLSNVPDYTGGPLGTIVNLAPLLEDSKYAKINFNCLLNCGAFRTIDDFCFHYTLCSVADLKRIYGNVLCDEEDQSPTSPFFLSRGMRITVAARTAPFSQTVSKQRLHDYLKRLLLRFLCPTSTPQTPMRIEESCSLVMYFRVLDFLVRHAGCPAHWVAEVLQSILEDNVVTDARPYTGVMPIPPSTMNMRLPKPRKVNLKPWLAEIEAIVSAIKPTLPFELVNPPRSFASLSSADVVTLTAEISVVPFSINDLTQIHLDVGLMFYRLPVSENLSALIRTARIAEMLEGGGSTPDVQFFSTQEGVDICKGLVSWRMTRAWLERMKREGWKMVVYVTVQAFKQITQPLDANHWKEDS